MNQQQQSTTANFLSLYLTHTNKLFIANHATSIRFHEKYEKLSYHFFSLLTQHCHLSALNMVKNLRISQILCATSSRLLFCMLDFLSKSWLSGYSLQINFWKMKNPLKAVLSCARWHDLTHIYDKLYGSTEKFWHHVLLGIRSNW